MADDQGPSRRSPREYPPDLRPMLVLLVVLVAIVAAWVFLSPVILPR